MQLLKDISELLSFKCVGGEKMPDDFLAALAERWPDLEIDIDTWVHDEIRACAPGDKPLVNCLSRD